jgi:N-acetyl-anhydromuramyl-L-alanine amidase AmpD
MASSIIYNSMPIRITGNCTQGEAFPNVKKRITAPSLLVFHWTGGERGDDGIYKTLVDRKLSVDFTIDYAGKIVQHNDPALNYTLHCGKFNARAIGVEIQNRGFPGRSVTGKDRGQRPPSATSAADLARLKGKNERAVETVTIHGQLVDVCMFTTAQIDAAAAIAHALCPQVIRARVQRSDTVMPDDVAEKFTGVCGHYHLSRQKFDPGPTLLAALFEELSS